MRTYDIWLSQGDTFNLSVTPTDISGNLLNLSGCIVTGGIQYSFGSTGDYLINLNPQIISGTVSISTYIPTNTIITKGIYDIQVINTGTNYVYKLLKGYANINPSI